MQAIIATPGTTVHGPQIEIGWDEAKNTAGLDRRGFAHAGGAFLDPLRPIALDRQADPCRRLNGEEFGYSHHLGLRGRRQGSHGIWAQRVSGLMQTIRLNSPKDGSTLPG